MILKGNRRGGGMQMAIHLLNAEDNEHVTIHEMRGFISDSLREALTEAYAISRGTRCKKFLYSLSLSPPEMESVPVEVFEKTINDIEEKLGFADQPRAIVFHEKEGRRHAHCIWSRIDVEEMKAIDPSYDKLQLRDMSRELYLEHGWKMPRGLMNSKECDPLNFTQAEWQQAKRAKQDPRAIKQAFQDCWAISDSRTAFANALEERGYYLAKGDRRGFVAVDWRGEIYAISRWVGFKTKDIKARLGSPDELPSVETIQQQLAERFTDKLQQFVAEANSSHEKTEQRLRQKRQALVKRHRQERAHLNQVQETRRQQETLTRSSRLPTGLMALWFRVTGKYRVIKKKNETEAKQCKLRDQAERQNVIDQQLLENRELQHEFRLLRHQHGIQIKILNRDVNEYLKLPSKEGAVVLTKKERQSVLKHNQLRRS